MIRGWYAKLPEVLPNVHNLTSNAEESAKAFLDGNINVIGSRLSKLFKLILRYLTNLINLLGNLEKVGNCLNEYWRQKKKMAPGISHDRIRLMKF